MNKSVTKYDPKTNMGLFVLHPSDEALVNQHGSPNLDIVAVHGLNGDCFRSWSYKDPKSNTRTMWLKEMLPKKMPRVRTMTFGYDASVVGNTSVAGIRDNARKLLRHLCDKRENDGSRGRPIVFLGHSLGGIIIKQALCIANIEPAFNDILSSTRGIVFFGTPHRGTDAAVWGETLARIKFAAFGARDLSDLFRALRPDGTDLMNVSEDFRPMVTRFAISSFFEEYPIGKMKKVIVDKKSAVLEATHESYCAMPGDHSSIIKFSPGPEDEDRFTLAWRAIERVAKGPNTSITAEFRAEYRRVPEGSGRNYAGARWEPAEVVGRINGPGGFGHPRGDYILDYPMQVDRGIYDVQDMRIQATDRMLAAAGK
ncbi:hypothetical protein VTJ83DRAFT_6118 [Remersonia thermophila]|uniref:DUF676 domain-containing protein n=1 Tax=Remersonia thermophila TaxID=72144 RepID=A0ABR4DAC5_9PEZI